MSMHIFVPAMPAVATSLHAGHALVQATLTAYVLGLGAGQLVHGPLSDRFGRRPVLIAGMVVYALASLVALAASSIGVLIAARLLQALGAGAGVVLGRAIVRDSVGADRSAGVLSILNLLVLLAPGLSPVAGSLLTGTAGWRSIFALLALLGMLNAVAAIFLLRETVTEPGRGSGRVIADYAALLANRSFVGWAVAGSCASASLYGFIGAAPFIFIHQLHRPSSEVGFYLALNIIGIAVGSLLARLLTERARSRSIAMAGNALSALGAGTFVVVAWRGGLGLPEVLGTMFVFTAGCGLAAPIAMAEVLNVDPRAVGSSSGLYGCTQMMMGAACTSLAGLGSSPALAAGLTMLAGTLVAGLCIRLATRKAIDVTRR